MMPLMRYISLWTNPGKIGNLLSIRERWQTALQIYGNKNNNNNNNSSSLIDLHRFKFQFEINLKNNRAYITHPHRNSKLWYVACPPCTCVWVILCWERGSRAKGWYGVCLSVDINSAVVYNRTQGGFTW